MKLPTEKSKPQMSPDRQIMLLYGPPKIGKTTFCASIPNALILATEAGTNCVECFEIRCTCWPDFLDACRSLQKDGGARFSTVVIDTVDNLWSHCRAEVLAQLKVTHESDLAFGKGWGMVQDEFRRVITKLSLMGLGLVFVSHADERDVTDFNGKTHTKKVPTLPRKAREFVLGLSDLVLFADIETTPDGHRRVLRTKPSHDHEAGDRTGLLAPVIPLSYSDLGACFTPKAARTAPPPENARDKVTPWDKHIAGAQ